MYIKRSGMVWIKKHQDKHELFSANEMTEKAMHGQFVGSSQTE